jgi:hypothetical protein
VVAEEAVERKEARRVKPWLSELDVPEWQEPAGGPAGVVGYVEGAASIKARAQLAGGNINTYTPAFICLARSTLGPGDVDGDGGEATSNKQRQAHIQRERGAPESHRPQ